MFNTTTIPTSIYTPVSICHIASILSIAALIGASVCELFLYRMKERRCLGENLPESETEEENYCDKYVEEFEALPARELSEEELTDLNKKIVREQVAEEVEVILTFDKSTDTFWYYTDKLKDVSYDILETVARKFAIDYDCKAIFLTIEGDEEPASLAEGAASLAEGADAALLAEGADAASLDEPAAPTASLAAPSVFAKFKNYNTGGKGSTPNFTSVIKVIEQMNHFRYRGKICDYEETLKVAEKKIVEEKTIDYASYKKLLETTKIKTL
jgi:hypothetical protein